MSGLITLVNDNHLDNYLKEILAFVYYSLIVNNRPPKNISMCFSGALWCSGKASDSRSRGTGFDPH